MRMMVSWLWGVVFAMSGACTSTTSSKSVSCRAGEDGLCRGDNDCVGDRVCRDDGSWGECMCSSSSSGGAGGTDVGTGGAAGADASGGSSATSDDGGSGGSGTGGAGAAGGGGTGATGGLGTGGGSTCDSVETVTVPDCCSEGVLTEGSYSGIVKLSVSGVISNTPSVPYDAFYRLRADDQSLPMEQCAVCLQYKRESEGACVCPTGCSPTGHQLSDLLIGEYPTFEPTHEYTVTIDIGGTSVEQLYFAFADSMCDDNTGSWTLRIAPGNCSL